MIEEPGRGALPDDILIRKEGLVGDIKVKNSLGYSDCKIVQFRIMRGKSWEKTKIRSLHLGLFRDLLGRVPWDETLEEKEVQEDWFIFKEHYLQAKEQLIQTSRKSSKDARWPAWLEEAAPGKLKHKKETHKTELETSNLGGKQRHCPSMQRCNSECQTQLEFSLVRYVKYNKKGIWHYVSSKRRARDVY